ncbi:hypothetical protein LCGC14_2721580 [marine sediment metagenome]|uniref:Uncharacterized protein n=1 Tax=marine sediment metagenome TaxID=412755 RepID=A0A0F9BJ19_9ZZZZ
MIGVFVVALIFVAAIAALLYAGLKPWPVYSPPLTPGWVMKQYHDLVVSKLKEMDEWRSPMAGLVEKKDA